MSFLQSCEDSMVNSLRYNFYATMHCYHPQTKLREGNIFTGVYLFTGGGDVPLPPVIFLRECFLVSLNVYSHLSLK